MAGILFPAATTMSTNMNHLIRMFVFYVFAIRVVVKSIDVNEYYPGERESLLQLREFMNSTSNLHGIWTGPPCHKNQSRWAGISCSNWHVTHLVLEGIELTGSLPPIFLQNLTFLTKLSLRNNSIYGTLPTLNNLVHLEFIFLSKNRFSGSIPLEYIKLPKLKKLELQENELVGSIPPFDQQTLMAFNVTFNHLSGAIPETNALRRFPNSSYDHNSDLCGEILGIPCPVSPPLPPAAPSPSPNTPSKDDNKKALQAWSIVLIAAAAALVPFLVILVFVCYYRKVLQGQNKGEENPASLTPSSCQCKDREPPIS